MSLVAAFGTRQAAFDAGPGRRRPGWRWRRNWLAYVPLVPYVVWLMIRHRSPTVFTAANPGIATGGTVGESKTATLTWIQRVGGPAAEFCLVEPDRDLRARVLVAARWMKETGITFPVIAKPDIGEQGWGVALISSRRGLERYLDCMPAAVIVQRYLAGIEAGIFYMRRPGAEHGRMVSISQSIHRGRVPPEHGPDEAASVLFGFTCHEAEYRDVPHWGSPRLERAIDAIGRAVPGFFIGRFDVCAGSVDELRRGEFAIVELNGVLSEPTQIYDPATSFARACTTLIRQWRFAFETGAANRARGTVPTSLRELVSLVAAKIRRQASARRLRALARDCGSNRRPEASTH